MAIETERTVTSLSQSIPAIAGIDDPSQARMILYQAGRPVHAPLDNVGLLTADAIGDFLTESEAAATYLPRANHWEFIGSATPASVAAIDFTGLSAYRLLRLFGSIVPATDAVSLTLRTSTNNGSSYDAGASDYNYQYVRGIGATASAAQVVGATGIQIGGLAGIGNLSTEGSAFVIDICQFNQAVHMFCVMSCSSVGDTGAEVVATAMGKRVATTARNALRLVFSSGNVASGYVYLEGIRS